MRRAVGVALGFAAVAVAGCSASRQAATVSAPATKTAAAASALQAAVHAMAAATSYRFNAAVTVGGSVTRLVGEYQAPDRVREVVTVPTGAGAEVIFLGAQLFVHDARSGRWTRGRPSAQVPDPRQAFQVLASAQHVQATGSTLRFELPVSAAAQLTPGLGTAVSPVAGEAVTAPGGLAHLGFTIDGGRNSASVTVDYRDIGSAPPVTQPAAP